MGYNNMFGMGGSMLNVASKLPAGLDKEQVVTSVPTGGVFTYNTHTDGSNNQPLVESTWQNYNNVANPMTGSFVNSEGNPYGTDQDYYKQGNDMFGITVPRGHLFEEYNNNTWKRGQLAEDGSKLYTGKYEKQYLEGNNTVKGIGDTPGRGGFRVTTPKAAPLAAVAPNSGAFKNADYNWNTTPSAPVAAATTPQQGVLNNVFSSILGGTPPDWDHETIFDATNNAYNPSMNQGNKGGMLGLGILDETPPTWDHDSIFDTSAGGSAFGGGSSFGTSGSGSYGDFGYGDSTGGFGTAEGLGGESNSFSDDMSVSDF